ncbi:hypothetical protein ANN_18055 [Periplaneta americana]|uniref:RNase H type-1 domain-containing protein n=1 Tax=Periplaneta americana TaxID=6978 RepID=A0ABQ8SNY2_PERAM|nr:hypothetical protein ANN_18055 [Periplaneta americana]
MSPRSNTYSYPVFAHLGLRENAGKNLNQILYHKLIAKGKEVIFIWIPSHRGIASNDVADREAKQSTKDSTNPDYTFLPHRDFISLIDNKCKESWITLWTLNPSRKLFEVKSIYSINIPIHKLNRKDQVLLSRLRIGHTKLTHSYLISRNEPSTCETCHCLPLNTSP